MSLENCDISVFILGHDQGKFLQDALDSVRASAGFLKKRFPSIQVQIICVLDSPNSLTASVAQSNTDIKVFRVDFNNVVYVRNFIAEITNSNYMVIVDGDDLISINWLYLAYKRIKKQPKNLIVPEFIIKFDHCIKSLRKQHSYWSNKFNPFSILIENQWTSLYMISVESYKNLKFHDFQDQVKVWEDWTWILDLIGQNIRIFAEPKTFHYVRLRQESLSKNWIQLYPNITIGSNNYMRQVEKIPKFLKNETSILKKILLTLTLTNQYKKIHRDLDLHSIRPRRHYYKYGIKENRLRRLRKYVLKELKCFHSSIHRTNKINCSCNKFLIEYPKVRSIETKILLDIHNSIQYNDYILNITGRINQKFSNRFYWAQDKINKELFVGICTNKLELTSDVYKVYETENDNIDIFQIIGILKQFCFLKVKH